jgi:AcrR family transcriptional regulator
METTRMSADTPDTRTRIQAVALELFTEQGYDQTSLREIAERLGVTKAALYYHFKTKDDIITSVFDDRLASLEALLEWARGQERTPAFRRELLTRYAQEIHKSQQAPFMRFFERNQTMIHKMKAGLRMREMVLKLHEVLTAPGAPINVQIKNSLAIFALQSSWFIVRSPEVTEQERYEAALTVALDLLEQGERESVTPAAPSGASPVA